MMYKTLFASLLASVSATTLPELLAATPDLSKLAGLIGTQPELAAKLAGASNITILAPNNDAIDALLKSPAAQSLANPAAISAVLQYHVIQGTYASSAIPESLAFVPTLLSDPLFANVTGGQRLGVQRSGSGVTVFSGGVSNSSVVLADVKFDGGVVHVINKVLTLPANASATAVGAGLTSLAGALTTANLVSTVDGLKDVTIFAPTNAAFEAIASTAAGLSPADLASVLTYHVVQAGAPLYSSSLSDGAKATTLGNGNRQLTVSFRDGGIFVNNAKVVIPNVIIAGGVVHVIDSVLLPNASTGASPSSAATPAPSAAPSGTPTPASGTATPASTSRPSGAAAASPSVSTGAASSLNVAVGVAALFGAGAALFNL